jgi:hypothetical protein
MRKPPQERTTRLLSRYKAREDNVVRLFRQNGAKLIDCHGGLDQSLPENKRFEVVPENTAIIFLSQFGTCMGITIGRQLGNEWFTSKEKLEKFFRGEAGKKGIHHGEIASRTMLPGEMYPNALLEFEDKERPDMGYVWKLPLSGVRYENANQLRRAFPPSANKIYSSILHGYSYYLKEVIDILGPGVYIVAACLIPHNQAKWPVGKIPFNIPAAYSARRGPRVTKGSLAYKNLIFGKKPPLRPGSTRKTIFVPPKSRSVHPLKPLKTREVLMRLGRPGGIKLNLIKNIFPRMSANANRAGILIVQNILKNPNNWVSKLNATSRAQWNSLRWYEKGPFVYNRVKGNNNNGNNSGNTYYVSVVRSNGTTDWWNANNMGLIREPRKPIAKVNNAKKLNNYKTILGNYYRVGNNAQWNLYKTV